MIKSIKKSVVSVILVLSMVASVLGFSLVPSAKVDIEANKKIIFNYIVNEIGLSPAAACGILINMYKESGLDPSVGTSGSIGLCQWMFIRLTNIQNFCKERGYDYKSMDGQLAFLKYEFETTETRTFEMLKALPNTPEGAYEAAVDFCKYFERGGNEKTWASRGTIARDEYFPALVGEGGGEYYPPVVISTEDPDKYKVPTVSYKYVKGNVMTGDEVKWIQAVLSRLGYSITVDGSYGPATETVVKQFQRDQKLDVDGMAGPKTRAKLSELWEKIKKFGDIDGNGKTEESDSVLLSRFLGGWSVDIDLKRCDLNSDGKTDEGDAVMLGRFLAGWSVI